MIKINKDLEDIPESLQVLSTNNTHVARLDVINRCSYYNEKAYNKLYKKDDIKEKLDSYYHHKCAYCEQRVEQFHIEHYRPKKEFGPDSYAYYWLAFSWDNLLVSCPTCNQNKGNKFRIRNHRATFELNDADINNINSLSSRYDAAELPYMVNPEVTEPKSNIHFSIDGKVTSANDDFKYTIDEVCKLSRKDLNDQRRKLITDFENQLQAALLGCSSFEEKIRLAKVFIRNWEYDSYDNQKTFLAFRRYALENNWLEQIVKSALSLIL